MLVSLAREGVSLVKHADVLNELDELIRSRSILQHPFYLAWRAGALTREQLASYAEHYYPHVAAFPGYLEAAIDGAADPVVRAELERNLHDERTTPKPHHEMWLDFAEGVGADVRRISCAPFEASAKAIRAFASLARGETAAALAALYAYESQQPQVSEEKRAGLRVHYGVSSAKALAYFDIHATIDVGHREGERGMLARCLDAGASREAVVAAANDALRAYWGLLDGICAQADVTAS